MFQKWLRNRFLTMKTEMCEENRYFSFEKNHVFNFLSKVRVGGSNYTTWGKANFQRVSSKLRETYQTTALVNFLKASVPRKPYSPGGLAGRSSAPRCVDEQWTSTGFEVDSSFVGLQEKPIAPFTLSETVLTSNRPFNFLNAGRLETKRKKG